MPQYLHPVDQVDPLDVIAVGAHPDDVEIACGGTLAALVKRGHRVGIIDLTDGEPTPGSESPQQRWEESVEAAQTLGVHQRVTLDLPNRALFDTLEARMALAIEFRRYQPQLVIGFGDKTPLASPDHWQAMQITDAAVFYSRLTKWDDRFEHLAPHKIERQLYFRVSFEAKWDNANQIVMDISDTFEQKVQSIRCYRSQFPPAKEYLFDRVRGAALLAGSSAGFGFGEVFTSPRAIGTRDLVRSTAC